MEYFIKEPSLEEKIIGSDYPQAYKFVKGYNPDEPRAFFSLYKYKSSFPDYIPELDGIMLSGSAKLTDFISGGFSPQTLIVSEKAKSILEQYHLCPHRFYPMGLYKRKIKYNYYLFFIVSDYIDFIDYKKTSFVEYNIVSGKKFGLVSIASKEELFFRREIFKKEKGISQTIWGDKIVMNQSFDSELDFFEIRWIDANTYVSKRLKNAIESNRLTGWEFTPTTNLIVK